MYIENKPLARMQAINIQQIVKTFLQVSTVDAARLEIAASCARGHVLLSTISQPSLTVGEANKIDGSRPGKVPECLG